jgi:hypothetical protein
MIMDDNARQTGQEAQDAQNAAIAAFLKMIASLIGQASAREVKLEDLTLMSGTKKAWPSDNPDLELTAKIQDAFTNPDSKASVRIFLEYADGTKEEIFRQTAGKVVKDPLGLAPAMREMFAKQAADKFTEQQRPKVIIEADSQTVTADASTQEKAKVLGKKGIEPEIRKTVSETITVPKLEKAEAIKEPTAVGSVQTAETVNQPTSKEQMLMGRLAMVDAALADANRRADTPGMDYLKGEQWFKDLETESQSLRAQLGIAEPAAAAVAQEQNPEAVAESPTIETQQEQLEKTEAVTELVSLQSNQERHQNFILTEIASSQASDLSAVTPLSLTEDNEMNVLPSLEPLKVTPSIQEQNEMFVLGAIASSVGPDAVAHQDSPALATVPNANLIIYESWIPAFPELTEVSTLANYEGQTLDITPFTPSPSDLAAPSDIGAFKTVSIQPFLTEVTQLSAQIESLREQTNQKLSELAALSGALKETVMEPKLEQWSQQTIAVVETDAVSLGDRLKSAAINLRDTVKERAANDWKIVVDTVKERASEDWAKTVDVVKTRAAGDFETVQKWAIGAQKVDKGIDTLIDYVGQKHPNGGMAQMDGYTFIHKNGQTGIFKGNATEAVYKNGLLTDKASPKDAAYIAQLPQKAQNAAAAVDAYKASQAAQASAAPAQSQGTGMSRGR